MLMDLPLGASIADIRALLLLLLCLLLLSLCLQLKYSWFMHGLREENIQLNRKMLSELAIFEPHSFKALVSQVQHMRPTSSSSSSNSSNSSPAPPGQS
jgi:hypothetical protein